MRVTAPSKFFVLDADRFGQLMREWFPMAVHLLEGLFFGNQNAKQVVDQRERLLALGSLSAGLTHELNNPAAAAVRATASLRDRVSHMRQKLGVIASGVYDRQALATLIRLQEETAELVAKAPTLSPLEASDREDELGDWFDDHASPAAGTWRPRSCRPGSTCRGWNGSSPVSTTQRWSRARSAGSTTPSRPNC